MRMEKKEGRKEEGLGMAKRRREEEEEEEELPSARRRAGRQAGHGWQQDGER